MLTYALWLSDDPGVLSQVLTRLSQYGVNILTVNQNIPIDRVAMVTISFRADLEQISDEEGLLYSVAQIPGVERAKQL